MKRISGLLLVFFLLISPSLAKDKKVEFDAQAAWSYIKDLAADFMQGRKSGQPGGVMGEEYIASKFKEWGLEPAGDNGTYFQNFTIEHRNIGEGVAFEIITDKARRDFYYGEDWRVQRYSGSGHFTAEIVFVGYGIHAPKEEYDEYAGVDVKGKVVLFATSVPQRLQKKLGDAVNMDKRVEAAQKLGACGILAFRPSTSTQSRYFRMRVDKKLYKPDFVMLSVERKVTDFIFKDLKTDLRSVFQKMGRTSKPVSFETGEKIFVSVDAIFDEKRAARNVLAKISGTDKKLKDEYIIIGAHMDHLGIGPMGDVYNGANDNASGSAVVMELARIMKLNHAKPKRTVIFATWAGEEQGLLGSKYYADHPTHPIEKAVANINLDMVGFGSGKLNFGGIYYAPNVWKVIKENLPKEMLDFVKPGRGGPGGSDHTPFLGKGVPAFFGITVDSSLKYHHPRDDSDLIQPELLKKTGDFVHAAVKLLASDPQNFIQPRRQENYYLKYQNIVNYKLSPIKNVIANHGDTKDSHVDLQLSIVEEKEGLSGDELRIDIINNLFDVQEKIKKTKGLSLYSSSSSLAMGSRLGKTTVITGLKGFNTFRDDMRWAQVLAKQGLNFIVAEDISYLFDEKGLNEEGKKIVKAVNTSGLLLCVKGANASQSKALLEGSKKPLVFFEKDLPDKDVLDLIKKKESAIGLILTVDADPTAYFKKMDKVKKAIGTQYLMMVNEQCLWGNSGKNQMLNVISEIIKAEYERSDLSNIFSSTFLRVLNKARGDSSQQMMRFRPF